MRVERIHCNSKQKKLESLLAAILWISRNIMRFIQVYSRRRLIVAILRRVANLISRGIQMYLSRFVKSAKRIVTATWHGKCCRGGSFRINFSGAKGGRESESSRFPRENACCSNSCAARTFASQLTHGGITGAFSSSRHLPPNRNNPRKLVLLRHFRPFAT